MAIELKEVLKNKAINGWGLFWLISIPMSIIILIAMMKTDMSTGEGVQHMIGYSVRFAVPFIFLVVAASSVQVLFPGPIAMWWLRNRKYIGLCFAVAMAWQGTFIFIVSTFFRDYYLKRSISSVTSWKEPSATSFLPPWWLRPFTLEENT